YLYFLLARYRSDYEPVIRPTFYDFPTDPQCYRENDEMMLGPSLLVAPVVEPGATTRSVYLPQGADWCNFWTGERFPGGQTIDLPAPWDRPVLLARAGSVIPLNLSEPPTSGRDLRGFLLFPLAEGNGFGESYEDDGETEAYREKECGAWRIAMTGAADRLRIAVSASGRYLSHKEITLLVPVAEQRPVELAGAAVLAKWGGM
ncbi:MAG: alpha-glucosidase, partial [Bryobacteraceae bacterium]